MTSGVYFGPGRPHLEKISQLEANGRGAAYRDSMVSLLAAIAMAAPSLTLEVVLTPAVAHPGQMVEVNLVVRNETDSLVSVCTTRHDGGMGAGAGFRVFRGGTPIEVGGGDSPSMYQVMVDNQVTSHRFQDLYKGYQANFWQGTFSMMVGGGKPRPSLKKDFEEWVVIQEPLPPGTYTVKGWYQFDRPLTTGMGGPNDTYEFTPTAKKMFDRSFKGRLEAETSLTITP
ncbi:MAG: hypothetical protein KIT11_07035 [Fimbriimonadaceae bacterium]|nr:hypothetical protein [Fimbriimonadaceae bacterium]QYK56106.1 MAG: hypothetical protein KF733_01225 [Fimbriimonadaceae bacterium]